MDKFGTYRTFDSQAVLFSGTEPVELLLRACIGGKSGEHGVDEADRSSVHGETVLRGSTDDMVAESAWTRGESQTRRAADDGNGIAGRSAGTPYQSASSGESSVSVSAQGAGNKPAESGVVCGHYICADTEGAFISGGDNGLVQPVCAGMGTVEYAGGGVLHDSIGSGIEYSQSGYLQYGSRSAVYGRGFHRQTGADISKLKRRRSFMNKVRLSRRSILKLQTNSNR